MALKFKGTVDVLPTEGVAVNDAYYWTDAEHSGASAGYRYCSAISGSITWSSYVPIKVIDNLALNTTYEGSGAPTAASNAVQFPTLDTGIFYINGVNGDVYAYVTPVGWNKW